MKSLWFLYTFFLFLLDERMLLLGWIWRSKSSGQFDHNRIVEFIFVFVCSSLRIIYFWKPGNSIDCPVIRKFVFMNRLFRFCMILVWFKLLYNLKSRVPIGTWCVLIILIYLNKDEFSKWINLLQIVLCIAHTNGISMYFCCGQIDSWDFVFEILLNERCSKAHKMFNHLF